MDLDGQVVLVTGASQGIGRATAEAFRAAGARVAALARNAAAVEALVAPWGADGLALACDVTDEAEVDRAFAALADRWGRLDVVFNNAGAGLPTTSPDEITFADWRRVVGVNLDGAFLVARAAFRQMRAQDPQGGRIVNNGSISAHVPRFGSAAYTASKHGVLGLTRSLSLDGRPFGIACCQIDIGNAASDMTARMADGVAQADGSLRPEPRIDVAHVARTVVQMAALPLDVNMQFVTVMATAMPFIGRADPPYRPPGRRAPRRFSDTA